MSQCQNIELAIRASTVPIESSETEEAYALGHRGVLLNRSEINSWNGGPVSINQYRLNDDSNPELLNKVSCQPVEYDQEIHVRYLRPPTPPPAGEIIIKQEPPIVPSPAPPLIIREYAPDNCPAEAIIYRELPPTPPPAPPKKIITIPGKVLEPPPRRVIIEKLALRPQKPPSIIIEKWLPFKESPRRVIFEPAPSTCPQPKVKNLIVQWQTPPVNIKKKITVDPNVVSADPNEYIYKYGDSLIHQHELRSSFGEFEQPHVESHANQLVGDLDAFRKLNLEVLEREGLSMFSHYLNEYSSTNTHVQTSSSYTHTSSHVHSYSCDLLTGYRSCHMCGQSSRICQYCGRPKL